jgi:hypothetical protein
MLRTRELETVGMRQAVINFCPKHWAIPIMNLKKGSSTNRHERSAVCGASARPSQCRKKKLDSKFEGPYKFAAILADKTHQRKCLTNLTIASAAITEARFIKLWKGHYLRYIIPEISVLFQP